MNELVFFYILIQLFIFDVTDIAFVLENKESFHYYKLCSQIEVPEHSNCRLVPY